jgi:DNA primase large subunit
MASSHIPNVFDREFYKVPFENASELVAQRKVFVRDGFAYVPVADVVSLLVGEFRMRLSRSLIVTAKILPRLEDDDRLTPILEAMERQNVGPDYMSHVRVDGQVTADNVHEVGFS